MSWPIAHAAFIASAERLLVEPGPPEVLGIDETRRGGRRTKDEGGRWTRLERFETNFVDLSGPGGLLGQSAGRTSKAVVDWLNERCEDWKAEVQVVVIDMCSPYRARGAARPAARRLVVDHFHLVRLANEMVTDVRQRVFREQRGRRGRKKDQRGQTGGCCSAPVTSSPTWALARLGGDLRGRRPDRRRSAPPGP